MKIISMTIALLISLPAYSVTYMELCEQQHLLEMSDALNTTLSLRVLQKTSENLIHAFAMKGTVVRDTDFSIMGVTATNYVMRYQIGVYTPEKQYTFSALIGGDVLTTTNIYVVDAKDNALINSIGQILIPPTEITCHATSGVANKITLQNDETGMIFRSYRLDETLEETAYLEIKGEIKFAP